MLKVYYRHTIQTPYREAEWVRVRECFFDHLTPRKAEVVAIKEEAPLDYMPYITEEFERATGLRLNGLPEFTLWIKRGSYFHGLLVERGQIGQCPHLIGAPLPKWPLLKPSESREESYRWAEGTEGPSTINAVTKRSPGNTVGSSAGTVPASSTAAEPARCPSQAAGAAIEPACYTIRAGHAAA